MTTVAGAKENSAGRIITVVLVFSLVYAVTRYHLVGPIPWKDFPFFILNKSISLAAFILLAMNFGLGPLRNLGPAALAAIENLRESRKFETGPQWSASRLGVGLRFSCAISPSIVPRC